MKYPIILFCNLLMLLSSQGMAAVVDDQGNSIELSTPPARIVSLAPHATEMLFAVGAGKNIVGAVAYSDYPEAAKKIPRVGGSHGSKMMDLERIIALQPDLIVGWLSGNGEEVIQRLKKLGLNFYVTEPREFEQVATNLERLGQLTGNEKQGVMAAKEFREELQKLKKHYENKRPVTLFYQIWNQPLFTINGEHLIGKVMKLCGAKNIFSDLPTLAPQVSLEAVLAANPEVIIASGMAQKRPEWLDEWQRWPQLAAVKNSQIYTINPDTIQRHTPRILQGAQSMCQYLEQARSLNKKENENRKKDQPVL